MSRLLVILSGTILSISCLISNPQVQGYIYAGETNIYVCNNVTGSWSKDEIIVHELGHIFWFNNLHRPIWVEDTAREEAWAYLFQSCWFDKKCNTVLKSLILKYK